MAKLGICWVSSRWSMVDSP